MKETPVYIFIGPEGAGKSTQAHMLAQARNLPLIATGDVLRQLAKEDKGQLGDIVRNMFAENGYLDASLIIQIVAENLRNVAYTEGIVLDGSLRTYEEVMHFDELFTQLHIQPVVKVFYITISEEESIKRLSYGRQRSDDIIRSVQTRLSHFHERLEERLALIAKKYQLITIDGMQDKEAVHTEIVGKIIQ